jgi:molybdenum cofactor cytidylyltransferase
MSTPAHVAVVLAAGGSRRLGQCKQLLTTQGETLVARAVRIAQETGPQEIFVITGADDTAVRDALAGLNVTIEGNPAWPTGLASSLLVASRALAGSTASVLVLAVDHVGLSVSHLTTLLGVHALDRARDTATGYADTFGIPAVLRASTFARAGELIGDHGFKSLWRERAQQPNVVMASSLLDDLDTPEDFRRAVLAGDIDPR